MNNSSNVFSRRKIAFSCTANTYVKVFSEFGNQQKSIGRSSQIFMKYVSCYRNPNLIQWHYQRSPSTSALTLCNCQVKSYCNRANNGGRDISLVCNVIPAQLRRRNGKRKGNDAIAVATHFTSRQSDKNDYHIVYCAQRIKASETTLLNGIMTP